MGTYSKVDRRSVCWPCWLLGAVSKRKRVAPKREKTNTNPNIRFRLDEETRVTRAGESAVGRQKPRSSKLPTQ